MSFLVDSKINLMRFTHEASVHRAHGRTFDVNELIESVALVAMKFDSDNINIARNLTTEGMNKTEKLEHLTKLKGILGHDIFELSTCNRILYLGFDTTPQELTKKIEHYTDISEIPFTQQNGIDAWKTLVKICSGLDSFMIGELQVMSQFRNAIAWHRKHDLINRTNESFFHHVVAANRTLRQELGFNKTTESMLNLATSSLEALLGEKDESSCVVLGFGAMGQKAVEALDELGQTNITVVSRSPEKSKHRNPTLADKTTMITFDEWESNIHVADVIVSTIRSAKPAYDEHHQVPVDGACTVMDFSWPPSVGTNGVQSQQTLLGMETWIRAARKLGIDWDHASTIEKSTNLLNDITTKFLQALSNRSDAEFRSFVYSKLESMALEWTTNVGETRAPPATMQAFSREIATWICTQKNPFALTELENIILHTEREVDSELLNQIASDVGRAVLKMNSKSSLAEVIG